MMVEATVDPNAVITLDRSDYNDLMMCISRYDEFLNHLNDTTMDITDDIRGLTVGEDCCYGEVDADEEIEIRDDEEEDIA